MATFEQSPDAATAEGAALVSKHTFSDTEIGAYVDHINSVLADDPDAALLGIPIASPPALFPAVRTGLLFAYVKRPRRLLARLDLSPSLPLSLSLSLSLSRSLPLSHPFPQ
jgi:hypothetical protein